jgi:hypothetical protein
VVRILPLPSEQKWISPAIKRPERNLLDGMQGEP